MVRRAPDVRSSNLEFHRDGQRTMLGHLSNGRCLSITSKRPYPYKSPNIDTSNSGMIAFDMLRLPKPEGAQPGKDFEHIHENRPLS